MWLFVLLFVCVSTSADEHAELLVDQAIDTETPGPLAAAVTLVFGEAEHNSSFWRRLLDECAATQTLSCVKRTVHGVLEEALDPQADLVLGESLVFARHPENKYSRELNEIPDVAPETTTQPTTSSTTTTEPEKEIAHHHHHVPVPVPVPVHHRPHSEHLSHHHSHPSDHLSHYSHSSDHLSHHHAHPPHSISHHPPPSHSLPHYPPSPHAHPPHDHDSYLPQPYEDEGFFKQPSGPEAPTGHGPSGFGDEFLSQSHDSFLSRNDFQKTQNELASWGLSTEKYNPGMLYPAMPVVDDAQSAALIRATELQLQAQHKAAQEQQQAMLQQQEQLKEQQAIMAQHRLAQEQQKQQQLQLKLKQDALRKQQILLEVQHQPNNININNKQGSKTESQSSSIPVYDPFYSPLLQKIDQIFDNIGYKDEGCRERLICSMYKRPAKYSPHSNLISTQLSKEPNELERPSSSNTAVVRFFRYMQAARDGQENQDCLNTYKNCSINTELN